METNDEILTVEEVATLFKVAKSTAWRWCREGKLPAFRIGGEYRVRKEDLTKLMRKKIKERQNNHALS